MNRPRYNLQVTTAHEHGGVVVTSPIGIAGRGATEREARDAFRAEFVRWKAEHTWEDLEAIVGPPEEMS